MVVGGGSGHVLARTRIGSGRMPGTLIGTGAASSGFGTDDCALKNSSLSPGRNEFIRSHVMCHRGK